MTTRTTAEERQALRELEAGATSGPWGLGCDRPASPCECATVWDPTGEICILHAVTSREAEDNQGYILDVHETDSNRRLVVATRNALPALLADLEDALAEVARCTRCELCAGTGTIYEDHDEGLREPLGCNGCEGTGRIDPPAVIQSLMRAWTDEKKVASRLRAEVTRLRRAIETYRAIGKWCAGHILDLLPPDTVPPDVMGMLYRADNEADPGTHPEGETAEVPRRTAELEAEVARQAAVIGRVRAAVMRWHCSAEREGPEALADIHAALDETEADRG